MSVKSILNGAVRSILIRAFPRKIGVVPVNEFPKSGATWLSQMLSEAINIPFPRNRVPANIPCIVQGHFIHTWGINYGVVVWRDVRDVLVSWYFYCLFGAEHVLPKFILENRRALPVSDYEQIHKNMPIFIKYCFSVQRQPGFTWPEFVQTWINRNGLVFTRYEYLQRDPVNELVRVVEALNYKLEKQHAIEIATKYSFENQSGRMSGEEKLGTFLRKGIAGDWKNYINRESAEMIWSYCGQAMIALGYETDAHWITNCPTSFE